MNFSNQTIDWKSARYTVSGAKNPFPVLKADHGEVLQEVAFCGRSNAGKSSLLNDLCEQKQLARVSKVPGKTQLIHFFSVADRFVLVDLPGYGYAGVSKELKKEWGEMMEQYFYRRSHLSLLLLLIDIRRDPIDQDVQMMQWARHHHKNIMLILTKVDKVSKQECKKNTARILGLLQEPQMPVIHYSVLAKIGKRELRAKIFQGLSCQN